jgi:glycosyltransferase involved in cell wall biosynthesis
MPAAQADERAASHFVLIPSYNTGVKLSQTVADALRHFPSVWVVIDGSTDGSWENLAALSTGAPGLRVIRRSRNGGKGAAVLDGLRTAVTEGFTHVLVMDADGQHPAVSIAEFIQLSRACPAAMILGVPVFDHTAPSIRVIGRRVSNDRIGDSLFGFRVYPLAPLLAIMESSRRMRWFDFDPEAAVRLSWHGVPVINQPVPVRYFRTEEGGVSHFRYGRDNIVLAAMHARLLGEGFRRLTSRILRWVKPSRH